MGDAFISKLSPGRAQMYIQEQGITHQNLHKQVIYHRISIKPWNGGDRGMEKRTLVEKNREGQGEGEEGQGEGKIREEYRERMGKALGDARALGIGAELVEGALGVLGGGRKD